MVYCTCVRQMPSDKHKATVDLRRKTKPISRIEQNWEMHDISIFQVTMYCVCAYNDRDVDVSTFEK